VIDVRGHWPAEYASVVQAFADNFADGGEQGAALAVYRHGELLLSIWAGEFDNVDAGIRAAAWTENTRVNIFSASKGLTALCVLQLVARGELELDKPVAHYWPEFAQSGKATITLREILCHRSGLSAFHDRLDDKDIFNWDRITTLIAAETPWWSPGTEQGYSPFMFGWILGELVRRVTGLPGFDAYFQTQIAAPLKVSCNFGSAAEQLASISEIAEIADTGPLKRALNPVMASDASSASLGKLMKADPRGVTNRAFANPMTLLTSSNTRPWRQAQIPAANGTASALALATIYGALADGKLLPEAQRALCGQEQSAGLDRTLGVPLRFSCGFMLGQDRPDCRFGRGTNAFGHPGAGGSLGFADPDYRLGFGYVTNRLGQSLLIDPRAIRLIDALYDIPELNNE
jgi:CubicO group peptidase (beta-lactamase class C family)